MIYRLDNAGKDYHTRHGTVASLRDIRFDVKAGERLALIGPSGAGKTTLFRLLNATMRASSGRVWFSGVDVGSLSSRGLRAMRKRIGTVYQQHHLVGSLSVLENTLCGNLGRWSLWHTIQSLVRPGREEVEQAMAALESVGLADRHRARADELSGGQQQRLAIARVLQQDPEVILADEPVASLDPTLAESILQLLLALADDGERTLIITLHTVDMALNHFPRIIGLREGRVAFDRPQEEVDRESLTALYSSAGVSTLPEATENQWTDNGGNLREPSRAH